MQTTTPPSARPPAVHVTFPLAGAPFERLAEAGLELDVYPGDPPEPRPRLLAALGGCDGLLCSLFDRIDAEALAAGTRLRVVAQFGVGYDNIDLRAATGRGIVVTNTPDVLTDATAEMAWALLLAAARRLTEGERILRAGQWRGWRPDQMLGVGVTGKTLGLVGAGRIGTAMALKSRGFEMQVIYTSPRPNERLERELAARRLSLEALLAEADFVSLHVPLTSQTRHLIGRGELARLKPTAVLINTARGAVVDETALVEALRAGQLAYAGLDVYENEPALAPGLVDLPNVVLAPHLGSATRQTREAMGLLAVENLTRALSGHPPLTPVRP